MDQIAISPCPNDTFAFYGILHGKTDYPRKLNCEFMDIEALNRNCALGRVDFCKVSFFAFLKLAESYCMLDSGAALGFGCGPLIVGLPGLGPPDFEHGTIAVPGYNTTANLLLNLYQKKLGPTREMEFHAIMQAVVGAEVDYGLIIHESRFTYQDHGLVQLVDLGAWWEETTGQAIPLGGIVAHRKLPRHVIAEFQNALRQSIEYAWCHRDEVIGFMKEHAQEMEKEVMMNHVELYVNDYTHSLGPGGRRAIMALQQAFDPQAKTELFFEGNEASAES